MIKTLSIKQKLIVMMVVLVLPTVAVGIWHYFDIVGNETHEVTERNRYIASSAVGKLDGLVAESFGLIHAVSHHPAVMANDAAQLDRLFGELFPSYPYRLNILATDLGGNNVGSAVPQPQVRTLNYLDREWFVRARAGEEVVGDVHISKLFKQPSVMIAAPVRAAEGRIVGVIGVPFDLRKLNDALGAILPKFSPETLIVVDRTGTIMIDTSDPTHVGSKAVTILPHCTFPATRSDSHRCTDSKGVERVVSLVPVGDRGWTVAATVPLSGAKRFALSVSSTTLLVSFGVGLVGSILAWWLGRTIIGQVNGLLAGMGEIERGNLGYSLQLSGSLELERVVDSFNAMAGRLRRSEDELRRLNAELEERVADRTEQLALANKELEAFSYSVSHDLSAPLRHLSGFSQVLLEDYGDRVDDEGRRLLERIAHASRRMTEMINGMLNLSRLTRGEIRRETVDLGEMAREVAGEIASYQPGRKVDVAIADGMEVSADPPLLRVVLENLLGNAWKYTRPRERAEIQVGSVVQEGRTVYFVRDNGVGFDTAYTDRLFTLFQRMHRAEEFEGDGIGLATVQRIIHRHGGRVWVEAAVDRGATFFFSLN